MMKFLERKAINPEKWDDTVLRAENGLIYHLSFYLDAVSENWCALVNDDYSVIVPLAFKKKPGIKNVYQPFFCRQTGIVSLKKINKTEREKILSLIAERFNPIHFCTGLLDEVSAPFKKADWFFQELDLSKKINEIRSAYSDNAKRMLKKADQQTLSFHESRNAELVVSFFRKQKGAEIKELKPKDFVRLTQLMKSGIDAGYGKVYEVYKGEDLLACGFFWTFKNKITYLKGTASEEGKKCGAMYFLFDQVIQLQPYDIHTLDFGGSRIKPIAEFFRKFGSKDVYYSSLESGKLPFLYRIAKKVLG